MTKTDYSKNKHCKCGKLITNKSNICRSCSAKERYKYYPNPMLGKHHTKETKEKISKANSIINKPKCRCGTILSGSEHKRCWNCELKRRKISKNNGRWLGGISQHPYTYEFTNALKEAIRENDNHKCQKCNKIQKQELKDLHRKLTVHHIDYDKTNCSKSNLITLCNKCNTIANQDRDYWYAYFTYIMENR